MKWFVIFLSLMLLLCACALSITKDKENHSTRIELVPILPEREVDN